MLKKGLASEDHAAGVTDRTRICSLEDLRDSRGSERRTLPKIYQAYFIY